MTLLSVGRERLDTLAPNRVLRAIPPAVVALDLAIVTVSVILAALGRAHFGMFGRSLNEISSTLSIAGPLMVLGWIVAIGLGGGYSNSALGEGTDEYKRVLNSSLIAAGAIGIGCYLAKFQLSRGFFVLAFVVGIPALLLGRALFRGAIHHARRRGALLHRVVIAGSPGHVDEIASVLRRESWLGYHLIGALTPAHYVEEATHSGIPVLGNSDDATAVALEYGADVIFFAGGALGSATQMQRIVWDLEHEPVQVVVAPSVTDISGERVRIRPVGGLPLIHIDPPRSTDASRWAKRLFDLCGSLALLVIFSPLLLLAAIQIKRFDRGPILFRQTRIGRNGEEFGCFKFRTMVVNAEDLVIELQEQLGHSALLFKMKDDPRITRPGRWLRRYSVDELPQLLNVVLGDMSLIGPRPQVAREVALYHGGMSRRLRVRPGMTGLWQVSGRNDLSAEEAIRLDLYYVDNWSMMQDLSILGKTVGAVFSSRGAY
jgi:exopolysaccharide biosynthesis polyprenyl glycosylphosphotransferase